MVVWDIDTGLGKLDACFCLWDLHIQTCRTNFVCAKFALPVGAVAYTYSFYYNSRFGRGVDANLTNFRCYGNESHLLNCAHNVTSCGYTARMLCYGDVVSGLCIQLLSTTLSCKKLIYGFFVLLVYLCNCIWVATCHQWYSMRSTCRSNCHTV